jgi:uncharacterized repeat protein (TIGR03987 family)
MLQIAVSFIFGALVLYTLGVWAEKLQGRLHWWHAIVFWGGLVCDTIGTGAMGQIAGGIFQFNLHAVTGLIAIVLMFVHVTWATVVLVRKDEKLIQSFHKFSIFVWCVWLVPMLGGMIFGSMT